MAGRHRARLRVFGPDVIRVCRRLLTSGVRIGIIQLTSAPPQPGPRADAGGLVSSDIARPGRHLTAVAR
ncbi:MULTISPECIES: hypothetical protein [Streptomyces]|uniref:hypothetical protein n=1 Tax=Streptomyces TaxID=1883 RepID=UPI00292F158A|nr:hypothetical protein [Streptomyces sp. NEAU-HV9]